MTAVALLGGMFLLLGSAAPSATGEECTLAAVQADLAACDDAIAAVADPGRKAEMMYWRAYVLAERRKFEEALKDLDRILSLHADFPDALHERGYVLAELGDFPAALRDLDREVALRPDRANGYQERAYVRHAAGDQPGAYEDRRRVAALEPGKVGPLLDLADAALWLGRFDEASEAVSRASDLARRAEDEEAVRQVEHQRRVIELWSTRSDAPSRAERCRKAFESATVDEPHLIGDCTAAYLEARSASQKAEYLTYRSVMWAAGQQDRQRWLEDAEVAAALDPDNADVHVNLGGAYGRFGRARAALRRFDRALSIKESFAALAGRASARYDLGDKEGAFADAKRSFKLKPNELALIILGDLARDRGDRDGAKLFWMGAFRLGSRDEGTFERLRLIGIEDPEREPLQE